MIVDSSHDAAESLWQKLEMTAELADRAVAAQTPQCRDRHLQHIIWEGLTLQQRFARLCELCELTSTLRLMRTP